MKLKKGSVRHMQLASLARQIRDRELTIQQAKDTTIKSANTWMCEVILQGADLLKVKASLPHGEFTEWLRIHCPFFSHRTAQNYMRVAINFGSNTQRAADLDEVVSLRTALALCAHSENDLDNAKSAKVKWSWKLEVLTRCARLRDMVIKHPVDEMPTETCAKLREDLEPIARALWPDKFAEKATNGAMVGTVYRASTPPHVSLPTPG